jgi:hypothetical protein
VGHSGWRRHVLWGHVCKGGVMGWGRALLGCGMGSMKVFWQGVWQWSYHLQVTMSLTVFRVLGVFGCLGERLDLSSRKQEEES